MIYKNIKHKKFLKRAFLASALSLSLLGGIAHAREPKKQGIESALEKKISNKKPLDDAIVNYEAGNKEDAVDYGKSHYTYYHGSLFGNYFNNAFPEFTNPERAEISGIITDVKNETIDSYAGFVESSRSLSGNQKLAFLTAVSNLLYSGAYGPDNSINPVYSQDVFFDKLQDFLETGNHEDIGVCRHIATHIEKLAKDIGLRAASVTGSKSMGHVYDIIKTEDEKTAVIDGGDIILADTKNIEDIIEAYQREHNSLIFNHSFFEDSKFKYLLITENGKNFLKFVDYDESVNTLKDALISGNRINPDRKLIFNKTDSEISAEIDLSGSFNKIGIFYGNSSLPTEHLLFQAGYRKNFLISDFLYLNPKISFVCAMPANSSPINKPFVGFEGSLMLSTNNKKGINLGARLAGNFYTRLDNNVFDLSESSSQVILYDAQIQLGASYALPINNFTIEPYLLSKTNVFSQDIGTYDYSLVFSEINVGISLGLDLGAVKLSLDPHYAKRIWEQELGANAKIGIQKVEFSAGGYMTKSGYDFCPDKNGFTVDLSTSFNHFGINLNYKKEAENYDGEISTNSKFSAQGKLSF